MNELTKLVIKWIPSYADSFLEEICEDWMSVENNVHRNHILPALIDEKLKRYEREYEG